MRPTLSTRDTPYGKVVSCKSRQHASPSHVFLSRMRFMPSSEGSKLLPRRPTPSQKDWQSGVEETALTLRIKAPESGLFTEPAMLRSVTFLSDLFSTLMTSRFFSPLTISMEAEEGKGEKDRDVAAQGLRDS